MQYYYLNENNEWEPAEHMAERCGQTVEQLDAAMARNRQRLESILAKIGGNNATA